MDISPKQQQQQQHSDTNKPSGKILHSDVIMETQIKTVWCYYIPVRMAKLRTLTN